MNANFKIDYLSLDGMFGIFTRPALELALSASSGSGTMYVMDITGLHKLNKTFGYAEVNARLFSIFNNIQINFPNLLIGRIFSGDEIAIIDPDDHLELMKTLLPVFQREEINFRYLMVKIRLGDSPKYYNDVLNRYINVLSEEKSYQMI